MSKHTMRNRIAMPALILLSALPVAAKAQDFDDERYLTKIDTVVAFDAHGTVDLSLISGQMKVAAWDRQQVKVVASIVNGDGRLHFSAGRSKISLEVETDGSGRQRHRGSGGDARYEVTVPRGTRLVLEAVSGDILATGVGGEVEAQSVSGNVDVSDASRDATLSAVSGSVRAANISGDLHVESVSGDVTVQGAIAEIHAESVSGRISLQGIRSSSVRTETVSGSLTYSGSIDAGGRYTFDTHSGTVRLNLPANVGAVFSVQTFSGDIDSDFPVTMQPGQGRGSHDRFEFTIGDGKAKVSAESFSGRIIINRAGGANDRRQD